MIPMEDDRKEQLRQLCKELIRFKKSPLYKERIQNKVFPVFGEGTHYAKVMFIGEAPGRTEAETGRPFAGAAGRILDQLLESINISRKDVYITNVVKDRPTNNRDPLPHEIELYAPFLDRQIEIIQPIIICLLGRHSMKYIMQKFGLEAEMKPISTIHGKTFEVEMTYGKTKIMPLYHPAVALYNPNEREAMIKDFKVLAKIIKNA